MKDKANFCSKCGADFSKIQSEHPKKKAKEIVSWSIHLFEKMLNNVTSYFSIITKHRETTSIVKTFMEKWKKIPIRLFFVIGLIVLLLVLSGIMFSIRSFRSKNQFMALSEQSVDKQEQVEDLDEEFFSNTTQDQSITGFEQLQLCTRRKQIEENINKTLEGKLRGKYSIGIWKHNSPIGGNFDADYIEYLRLEKGTESTQIHVKYTYTGTIGGGTLWAIDMLWDHIDDIKAKKYYYASSAREAAENQARDLAIGLGKKYGIEPKIKEDWYEIADKKTNNILTITVMLAQDENIQTIFKDGYNLKKDGYYIRIIYLNKVFWGLINLQENFEKEK